ncbi:MAG TPA: outer-membrane lipoprotein carrier protein LolA [Candidatus Methylomirabilis sp.]|nr:outer-membrane lipoprotein carrier protein LolA [Candidatus Methylomirabilis sp.]
MVRRFEERYRSATALEAAFLERYTENGHLTRAEAGIAYFHRPGRMRWEYESPEKNLFLVDSRWAWFYVPADHTVTRVPAKRSSDWRTPIVLLADNPKLSKVCSQIAPSVTVSPDVAGDTVLFCFMRGSKPAGGASDNQIGSSSQAVESRAIAQGDAIFLELEPQTGVLTRVLVTQPGGISIEFRFSNWQFDPILPDSLFRFEPPAGVAIVDGELPAEGRR